MAVLDRGYRAWEGERTAYWQRMLVLPRFALAEVFSRKLVVVFYACCFVPPLVLSLLVYLSVNFDKIRQLVPAFADAPDMAIIGHGTYLSFWIIQSVPVCILTLVAGPPLVARDLANDALPLYFSKALRRGDYILGKALVLLALLGSVSLLPLSGIHVLHWLMADAAWRQAEAGTALAILVSSAALILVLTAIVLAVSAHVKRTRLAQVALVGIFFLSGALGGALAGITGIARFEAVSPVRMVSRVAQWSFVDRIEARQAAERREAAGLPAETPEDRPRRRPTAVPVSLALSSLGAWLLAAVVVLARKIQPVEVVG